MKVARVVRKGGAGKGPAQQAPRPHPTLCALIASGDLDDYIRYYKNRYRDEHHLARYDPATIENLPLTA